MDSLYMALHSLENGNNNTEYISLIIALLAVFFSPIINHITTKHTIDSQSKSAKEQIANQSKIAELNIKSEVLSRNRQDWINTLRISISEFTSLFVLLSKANEKPIASKDDKWEKLFMLKAKISLLINPNEDDHQQLEKLIENATQFVLKDE